MGCPDPLQFLFLCGTKHQPEALSVVMSPAIRQQMHTELDEALRAFADKEGASWSSWATGVGQALWDQLQGPDFDDGTVFTNSSKPHQLGTRLNHF